MATPEILLLGGFVARPAVSWGELLMPDEPLGKEYKEAIGAIKDLGKIMLGNNSKLIDIGARLKKLERTVYGDKAK